MAHQVGKTTVVRILAKELGITLVEINLEDNHSFESMLKDKSKAGDIDESRVYTRRLLSSPHYLIDRHLTMEQ